MKIFKITYASSDYQRLVATDDTIWTSLRFDGSAKNVWTPPKVIVFDPLKKKGDFLAFASGALCVRDEKLELVRSSFEMAGQILRLDEEREPIWCLNVLVCVNCVDEAASEWLHDPKTGRRITLMKPSFRHGFVATSSIFKVPQQPGSLYVWEDGNEGFYFEYHSNRMTGLRFEPMNLV